ncbi:MAG: serine/threonine protein kinase [Planctomycetes bacterium]|nr:serine/threonine protein kinase [Planctomycetota bacterium]
MSEYEVLKRGDRLSDRYVLERHLGRGGMGTVWLATDEELDGLPVAVKLLLPEYAQDAQFVASLKDEAKNSMKLAHPNIVRVFNFHRDNGDPGWTYLVLKYVPGRTMKELLGDSPQGLPVDRVLRWAGQLATALDYAHEAGMLHRDLKPSNMMIDENTDSALLMDFGISRQLDQTIAAQSGGSSIGTPVYMSPQALHNKDSAANDIYSFAAMLYEALSGRPPFTGPDIEEQILRVQAKPIPGIPDEVNEGILAGLAKEAEARPATATNLVAIMNDECNDTIFTDPVPPADTARSAHESSREAPAFAPLPMLVAALAIVVVGVALGAVPAISHPIRSLLGSGKPATPSAPGQPPVLTPSLTKLCASWSRHRILLRQVPSNQNREYSRVIPTRCGRMVPMCCTISS